MNTYRQVDILLVEGNPHDLDFALRVLQIRLPNSHIAIARDGEEALRLILGHEAVPPLFNLPKVIVLDLRLPGLSGLEVLRALKSDARARLVPIVVLTASRDERDILASYALGSNSYIVKPIDLDQFEYAVQSLGVYWVELNQFVPT